MSDTSLEQYNFPVFGTQGGGLARREGSRYVFITKPDCPGLDVGDEVPKEWDLAAANKPAREETLDRFAPNGLWGDYSFDGYPDQFQ